MQAVLSCKSNRAVHLVGNRSACPSGLTSSNLSRGDRHVGTGFAYPAKHNRLLRSSCSRSCGRRLTGLHSQVVLHRLKFRNRAAELISRLRILNRLRQHVLKCACDLVGTDRCAHEQ